MGFQDGFVLDTSKVSVVIVNYNAGRLLAECIESVLSQVDEVLVVDNASSDTSIADCKWKFYLESRFNIIQNESNLGFAAACNIGLSCVKSDYILFLNPDCRLEVDVIPSLLQELQKDSSVGMVGGLLVNVDGTEQCGGRRSIPTPWRSFVHAFGLTRFAERWPKLFSNYNLYQLPLPDKPIEVEAISGACMLVKKEAINDVGVWDEGYFLHCEDLDWCMRFRQKGWKILFVSDAKVTHVQGACSASNPIFVEWHKHKGMVLFYRKFFRHQYPGLLMWLVYMGVWFRFGAVVLKKYLQKVSVS